jgi:hypothetical protein
MTEEDWKILPWTKSGELSDDGQSQLTQIVELIKSSPPSQISDAEILDMENALHQIYHYPENPVANPVRAWVGEALDAMSSAASITTENPGKRPPEVSRNLRITGDALDNALIQNDIIESSKP